MSDWEQRPAIFPGEWVEDDMVTGQLTEGSIEQEIKNVGADKGPRLTPDNIDAMIGKEHYWRVADTTTIVCCLELTNGFTVIGKAACVDKRNFNEKIGRKIAFDSAREKIWELEGYRLRVETHAQEMYFQKMESIVKDDRQLDLGY